MASPKYHKCDYAGTTNVMQLAGLITLVKAPPDDLDTIGKRIAWARKAREMSQEQLAAGVGLSQSAIANYETEIRAPKDLVAIAQALHASSSWLRYNKGTWTDEPGWTAPPEPPAAPHGQTTLHDAVEAFDAAVQRLVPARLEELRDLMRPYLKAPAKYQHFKEDIERVLSGEGPSPNSEADPVEAAS